MTQPRQGRAPRYRMVVYELDHDNRQSTVMDATASGFIAAAATIHDGVMDAQLADGGPRHLQQHIAILIAREYRA
jgi:hypothetical protein